MGAGVRGGSFWAQVKLLDGLATQYSNKMLAPDQVLRIGMNVLIETIQTIGTTFSPVIRLSIYIPTCYLATYFVVTDGMLAFVHLARTAWRAGVARAGVLARAHQRHWSHREGLQTWRLSANTTDRTDHFVPRLLLLYLQLIMFRNVARQKEAHLRTELCGHSYLLWYLSTTLPSAS
ncbi:hypothetical protein PoMZ_01450 [Pyricularia oryzae]|uniref:Uncharacterized protein n=1 Tax=Pyricularia oryzae TaxID=318829 RepID=A0A4P7N5W7_PYROR|nr:hypothetical protein PoMZ_01450 [Pyricularia oryzae]